MTSDIAFLKNLCEENDVDYELAMKLKAKLFPLLENAHRRLGHLFDKALLEQRRGTIIRLDNSGDIQLILRKLPHQLFSVREQMAISLHLEYLSLVEGFFATQVNFLAFTLVANGHDLYSTLKGNYVESLNDIEEVSLAFKLRFLRRHSFGIVADKANIRLRNSVAHLFYHIEPNGNMKFGNREVTQPIYKKIYDDLRNISFGLHLVTVTYYRRFEASGSIMSSALG